MFKECVIYKITNTVTKQIYIGSSIVIKDRIQRHFKDLKADKHHSQKMQRSYNKYGKEGFTVEYLMIIPEHYRQKIEQWFLDNNDCYFNNEKIVSKPSIGRIRTKKEIEDTRQRMLGNEYWKLTPPMSKENKIKASTRAKNRVWSQESREKLSDSLKKVSHLRAPRKPHSEKTKLKMSDSSTKKSSVLQYSMEGIFLKRWESISEVVKELGFEQASISRCCQGKQKSSYGYIFKNNQK